MEYASYLLSLSPITPLNLPPSPMISKRFLELLLDAGLYLEEGWWPFRPTDKSSSPFRLVDELEREPLSPEPFRSVMLSRLYNINKKRYVQ